MALTLQRVVARRTLARAPPPRPPPSPGQPSTDVFAAYSKVSYDVWKRDVNPPGADPEEQKNGPWAHIGGEVGRLFGASDPYNPATAKRKAQQTCAARLSWALNNSPGNDVKRGAGTFYNSPKVTYAGTPGDGKYYIVGAPAMVTYLTKQWGKPDQKLKALDEYTEDPVTHASSKTAEGDASALRASLGPDQIAVFAGSHHVGVISKKLTTDDYIYYDPDVVPAWAWILP